MPAVCRLNDVDTGHGACGNTPITAGSPDVMVNGLPCARLGDPLNNHCLHGRSISAGSGSVLVNGKPIARLNDPINCGGTMDVGSPDVMAGG